MDRPTPRWFPDRAYLSTIIKDLRKVSKNKNVGGYLLDIFHSDIFQDHNI